jgi:signal transduction histidine kinase
VTTPPIADDPLPPGTYVRIDMEDTGIGMAPEVVSRVFEPFFTTKGASGGTGLGLSMVYGFAHQSGGTISASSTPGRGTRFTLLLPYGAVANETADARNETPPRQDVTDPRVKNGR